MEKKCVNQDLWFVVSMLFFITLASLIFHSSKLEADVKGLKEVLTSTTTTVVEEVNLIEPQACVSYPFGVPVPKAFSYSSGFWYYQDQVIASVKSEDSDFHVCGSPEWIEEIINLEHHPE